MGRRLREKKLKLSRYQKFCHLCGKPLDMSLPADDPHSVTLDHLTPRSRGGTDCLDNLHLAHRVCNSRRGNDDYINRAIAEMNARNGKQT